MLHSIGVTALISMALIFALIIVYFALQPNASVLAITGLAGAMGGMLAIVEKALSVL